jgi:hypothetical protein
VNPIISCESSPGGRQIARDLPDPGLDIVDDPARQFDRFQRRLGEMRHRRWINYANRNVQQVGYGAQQILVGE